MSKIEIPIEHVEIGGALFNFYYNKAMIRSEVIKTTSDTLATATDNFDLSISEVGSILANGGEVYEYLMAIRAPYAILETNVPAGLPKNVYFDGAAKTFRAWFSYGAEVWIKDDNTEVIFYTNPFAGNENLYLKGSEIKIIHDISAQVNAITIADAEGITLTGWTKIV